MDQVVDKVPYMQFQLFRGPYACKFKDGRFRPETSLEPESFFLGDPLTCFAGHVAPQHALPMASVETLLSQNDELRHFHSEHARRLETVWTQGQGSSRSWEVSPMDAENLYCPKFQMAGAGTIDLAGLTEVERFEEALQQIHPRRAHQWWSWFRISGVTCKMLQEHGRDAESRRRIWEAHMQWASEYPEFTAEENLEFVEKGIGRRVSGIGLLMRLVKFDNPEAVVRFDIWKHNMRGDGADDREEVVSLEAPSVAEVTPGVVPVVAEPLRQAEATSEGALGGAR